METKVSPFARRSSQFAPQAQTQTQVCEQQSISCPHCQIGEWIRLHQPKLILCGLLIVGWQLWRLDQRVIRLMDRLQIKGFLAA